MQSIYEKRVKDAAVKIVNDCYDSIEKYQTELFDKFQENMRESPSKLIKDVNNAAYECRMAVKRTETSSEKLFKLAAWRDLMWYTAPVLVLVWVVLKLVEMFM